MDATFRNTFMTLLLVLAGMVTILMMMYGCQALTTPEGSEQAKQVADSVEDTGELAGPLTGGVSSLVGLIASNIITAFLAINRGIVAHKRKKEVDVEKSKNVGVSTTP